MRRLLALLAVLALFVSACGDDGSTSDGSGGSTSEGTATDGGAASDEDDEPDDPELVAKLLNADELGTGWTQDPDEDDDAAADDDGPDCLADPPDEPNRVKVRRSFTFDSSGEGFPSLQEQVTRYTDESVVGDAYDTAVAAIDSCGEFSYTSDGLDFTGRIDPLELPTVGDASRAWTLHLATEGYEFTAIILYARTGTHGLSLYYLDQDEPDLAAFQGILDRAIAKV